MEAQVEKLTQKAWKRYQQTPTDQRLLIGISGIPGSGKTSLASTITARLNALSSPRPIAAFVPMDGYHLTRAQLSAMPNGAEALYRRGAAFTFDGAGFLALVRRVRAAGPTATIMAPSFDHAVKDPVADGIAIPPAARIVVFEGNYLALDRSPWREAGALMDELWFVEVGEGVARERLARRHVRAGIVGSYEEGVERAEGNDLLNGRDIVAGRVPVTEVVVSNEDDAWNEE